MQTTPVVSAYDESRWQWRGTVAPASASNASQQTARLLEKLEGSGQDQLILRLMARSNSCFRAFVLFADGLVNQSPLPAQDRETLVMYLAVRLDLPYEWHSHVGPAINAGLTAEQLGAIARAEPLRTDLFAPSQQLAVELAGRLLDDGEWSVDDWTSATATWGVEGALDLVLAIGWWAGTVSFALRALRLEPR